MPNIKLDFIDMAKSATSTDTINLLINMKNPDVINTLLQNNPNINEDHIQLLGELNKFPRFIIGENTPRIIQVVSTLRIHPPNANNDDIP